MKRVPLMRLLRRSVLLALLTVACAAHAATAAKPNVLFIIVDDLNDWVAPLGRHPLAKTPAKEFDLMGNAGGVGPRPPEKLIGPTPGGNNPLMDWGAFPHRDQDKGDYKVADWACEQLTAAKDSDKPFFLCVGFALPHVPCYV